MEIGASDNTKNPKSEGPKWGDWQTVYPKSMWILGESAAAITGLLQTIELRSVCIIGANARRKKSRG